MSYCTQTKAPLFRGALQIYCGAVFFSSVSPAFAMPNAVLALSLLENLFIILRRSLWIQLFPFEYFYHMKVSAQYLFRVFYVLHSFL